VVSFSPNCQIEESTKGEERAAQEETLTPFRAAIRSLARRTSRLHLIYIDSSGDKSLSVFSALAVPVDEWRNVFSKLRDFRRSLKQTDGISRTIEDEVRAR
jgi:hypothetical protein